MTQRRLWHPAALLGAALLSAALLALAGCGTTDDPPRAFVPVSYDYLTTLRLNVSAVEIDDSWAPRPGTKEVGNLAPTSPVNALRQMARDRLYAAGSPGRAVFVIDDASIVQNRDAYDGRMVVHLDVMAADGSRRGYAEARVSRTRGIVKDTPNATRAALADMVNMMMADMNVEFEFQIRRSLRAYLAQPGQTTAPAQVIQTEQLSAPTATTAPASPANASTGPAAARPGPISAPPPSAPPLSPPPGSLTAPGSAAGAGRPTPLAPTRLTP
jgi:hypothetical protein